MVKTILHVLYLDSNMTLRTALLIITLGYSVQASKILVIFPTPSFSHQQPIMTLTEKLVQKGNELFVISPDAVPGLKSKNYTYFDVSFSYNILSDETRDDFVNLQQQISKWNSLPAHPLASMVEEQICSEPFMQLKRLVETEKIRFDVVIMEGYLSGYTCAMARLLTGNAPIITMSTLPVDFYGEGSLGSFQHGSYVPSIFNAYTDRMSLWQKIDNWFTYYYLEHTYKNELENKARIFFREKYENENLVDGCSTNTSLTLITSNYLYFYPRLLGPNIIELGPIHIRPPTKLPKDLQDWLDGSEKGVIYFSLGSNMKSESLPVDARSNFVLFFKGLPSGFRVLWKWERNDKIPGQPNNVFTLKWMPQQSILAHPKVKVFITQGGLQSFQETVHYGIPTVGIPWFADQECNVAKMEDAKIGVKLLPQDLHSLDKIKSAVNTVLYDERYSENVRRLSAVSHDFTAQSLDKAVFWVEHVAKHGGAPHLRPSTANATHFHFFCLDIILVILAISFFVSYLGVLLFRCLISLRLSSLNFKIKKS